MWWAERPSNGFTREILQSPIYLSSPHEVTMFKIQSSAFVAFAVISCVSVVCADAQAQSGTRGAAPVPTFQSAPSFDRAASFSTPINRAPLQRNIVGSAPVVRYRPAPSPVSYAVPQSYATPRTFQSRVFKAPVSRTTNAFRRPAFSAPARSTFVVPKAGCSGGSCRGY